MGRRPARQLDVDKIARLAKARRLQDPFHNLDTLRYHLRVWWCFKYSRPFKDPLLEEYTLEELVYEFFVHHYAEPANDPLKEAAAKQSEQSDMDWARKMMSKMKEKGKSTDADDAAPKAQPPDNLPELSASFD